MTERATQVNPAFAAPYGKRSERPDVERLMNLAIDVAQYYAPGSWHADRNIPWIWAPSLKGGDSHVMQGETGLTRHPEPKNGRDAILMMRGWGYFTGFGHGALALDEDAGIKAQDRVCQHVAAWGAFDAAHVLLYVMDLETRVRGAEQVAEDRLVAANRYLARARAAEDTPNFWRYMNPEDQHELATQMASNVGYQLASEAAFVADPANPPKTKEAWEAVQDEAACRRHFELMLKETQVYRKKDFTYDRDADGAYVFPNIEDLWNIYASGWTMSRAEMFTPMDQR